MNKYTWPIVIGIILGSTLSIAYLWQVRRTTPVASGLPTETTSSTPAPTQKLTTWNDQAGFVFQYPDGLSVNKHDEDNENYAHIEFMSKTHPGGLIVWAKDTTAPNVSAWVRSETRFTDAPVLDTMLASQPAKKIMLTSPKRMLIVGTVSEAIVFSVEATLDDSDYWTGVHKTITDSFKFAPLPGEKVSSAPGPSSSQNAAGEEPVDEEEVLE